MKQSLRSRLAARLKEVGGWCHKGAIERRAQEWGFMGDTTARRLREMESGQLSNGKTCPRILEKKEMNGSVWYRYKKQEKVISTYQRVGDKVVEVKQETLC